MLVYVLDKNGQPLMPTDRCGKVRKLLKDNKAKVINRCPFTIQLLYETKTRIIQPVSLGIDAGSKHIGVSATTKDRVLYEADVTLRNDISDLITDRSKLRRSRRNRKTRYRKPRFNNRKKGEGWLAPSVQHKIDTHLAVIAKVHKILPVANIVVEVASFDTQLLKAQLNGDKLPEGKDYQQGELLDWNVREYVFHRDNYTCQWCQGKNKNKILHAHHWNYWRGDHTNKPSSMITLCDVCNDSKNHKPEAKKLWGWEPKVTHNFKDAAFMGIMRWSLYNSLKETYPDVKLTYGYITKCTRIRAGLSKDHYTDARCISGNPTAVSDGVVYYQKKVRCHNRQIHKTNFTKGHVRKSNQAEHKVKGFKLFDVVEAKGKTWYVHGRRTSGSFVLKTLNCDTLEIVPSKIKFLCSTRAYITERRMQDSVIRT